MLPSQELIKLPQAQSFNPHLKRPRDHCGIFAIENHRGTIPAAEIAFFGLQGLQHRGQESTGIAFVDSTGLRAKKGMGLVGQVFSRKEISAIEANTILGHVRYSTTGSSSLVNTQPLIAHSSDGHSLAIAHNGNLSNSSVLWQELLDQGQIFLSTSDTEVLLAYIYRNRYRSITGSVAEIMNISRGAYSAAIMDKEKIVAFRDPHGFRPLCIGRLGDANIFASETCALDSVGATFEREVQPGEIVLSSGGKLTSFIPEAGRQAKKTFCIFEYVYFARADSNLNGKNVHQVRKAIGENLAGKLNNNVDLIVPSPDSGTSAAMGLSEATGVPMDWAVYRNPYSDRTFIQPGQSYREIRAQLKYNPITDLVRGKSVAIVDDSIVRGTTARHLTRLLKKAGASQIHIIIASPPYLHPCYYGIDIPLASELALAQSNPKKMAEFIGADSLIFASLEDLYKGTGANKEDLCTACFTGDYPLSSPANKTIRGDQLEQPKK